VTILFKPPFFPAHSTLCFSPYSLPSSYHHRTSTTNSSLCLVLFLASFLLRNSTTIYSSVKPLTSLETFAPLRFPTTFPPKSTVLSLKHMKVSSQIPFISLREHLLQLVQLLWYFLFPLKYLWLDECNFGLQAVYIYRSRFHGHGFRIPYRSFASNVFDYLRRCKNLESQATNKQVRSSGTISSLDVSCG